VTIDNLLVKEGIGLAILTLDSHDPFHRNFVSIGVSWDLEKSITVCLTSGLNDVLRGRQNVAINIVFTQIIFADSAERFCELRVYDH